jgi:putative transposase
MGENPLALGQHFLLDGVDYVIDGYIDLKHLIARSALSGDRERLHITDVLRSLQASPPESKAGDAQEASGIETIPEADWIVARAREEVLLQLIEAPRPTRELAASLATSIGCDTATFYRWRNAYLSGGLAALVPHHPSGGRGQPRVHPIVEDILAQVIRDEFMTTQKVRASQLMLTIGARCRRAGLPTPHENTVRARIQAIGEADRDRAREGRKGGERWQARGGLYEGGAYPNALWQIDHTPLDVCVVDDVYRRNVARPWLTLVIDVHSRCIPGFYLALEKPNAAAVGMALVHAMLPKDGWLAAKGINMPWPIWGKPVAVHADNDKTFRCNMVDRAAEMQRINLEWRAVKTPHWGAHIERLFGTVNNEIHTIEGTTFSNPFARGDYKPHERSEFTFSELEEYLTRFICGIYHQQRHRGIGRPPIRKFEAGLLGEGDKIGIGLPAPIKDAARLRLDFLPYTRKTVQRTGVTWDCISYYDPVLDPWVGSIDPNDPRKKRLFMLRRDPRDISFVWFLEPGTDTYRRIPYRKLEHPSITVWELNAIRAHLREQGRSEVDEDLIFETYDLLQQLKADAKASTQAARRDAQKARVHADKKVAEKAQVEAVSRGRSEPSPSSDVVDSTVTNTRTLSLLLDDVEPFEIAS